KNLSIVKKLLTMPDAVRYTHPLTDKSFFLQGEAMKIDVGAIKAAAEGYQKDMSRFLRDMIAIPSESCQEEGVVRRIAAEMAKLGYDKVEIDGLGNVIG